MPIRSNPTVPARTGTTTTSTNQSALGQRRTTTRQPTVVTTRRDPITSIPSLTQQSTIPPTLEYEIRLLQEFTHPVGALRIINELDAITSSQSLPSVQPRTLESSVVTHYRNDIRSIRNLRPTGISNLETATIFERKVARSDTASRNGLYRFTISRETPISRREASDALGSDSNGILGALGHTYRLRYIYRGWKPGVLLANKEPAVADVHITFRTESRYGSRDAEGRYPITGGTRQSVSIELEIPSEYSEAVMNSLVQRIFLMHNGWDIPDLATTVSNMRRVLTNIGIRGPENLQTPYDITWTDLTYDNLIAKPHAISFKADGVRMLLVTSPMGAFFATSTMNIIPLSTPLKNPLGSTLNIIDGELMFTELGQARSIFWAFDLLFSGDTNYMSSPYHTRHGTLSSITQGITSITPPMTLPIVPLQGISQAIGSILVRVKPIAIPKTVQEFFSAIETARRYTEDNNIQSDGLIISGDNQVYSANVYKWKEPTNMTVDFFIGPPTNGNTGITLGTFLKGDINYHPEFIALPPMEREIDLSTLIGTVAEFQYIGPEGTGSSSIRWRYVRPRDDKGKPNAETVLNAILRLQRDPITWSTLIGKSLSLMRKYHNRVKRAIYDLLGATDVVTITDIGSGKGGDIVSWSRNNLDVIAIEPDMNNINDSLNVQGNLIEGLITRAQNQGASKDVINMGFNRGDNIPVTETVLQAECWSATLYNVDTNMYIDKILPYTERTDALTLFNSATFLGPNSLCTLVNESVRDSGVIVIMVIDGKVLTQRFLSGDIYSTDLIHIERVPCAGESTTATSIGTSSDRGSGVRGIGAGSDQFGNLGCIFIRLGDSATVGEGQTEGLVDVDVLLNVLRQSGWVTDIDMYLSQERLMGQEEAMYSSAQRLLVLRRGSTATHIVRQIYRPLPVGNTSSIRGSPWGDVVRVGVLGASSTLPLSNEDTRAENISFTHAILQAIDPTYRSLDNISKTILATGRGRLSLQNTVRYKIPIYIIPSNNWNMYSRPLDTTDQVIDMYPAIGGAQIPRTPGIVLMNNQGHWEPLAKRTIGDELQYIW